MKLISRVTNRDMGRILFTLAEARQRPQSADFLEGFPWLSVIWYKVEQLDVAEFEHLYLLWDGVAWGTPGALPRRLKKGPKSLWTWWLRILAGHTLGICGTFWNSETPIVPGRQTQNPS